MAVVNSKSAEITALDASPNTLSSGRTHTVKNREVLSSVVAADDDGSVYRVHRVRSSQTFYGIVKTNTAITSGTDYDFGLYRTAADGGAVVVKDAIVDGVTMASAIAVPTAPAHVANVIGKKYWELAGLSSDPCVDYDLCWTANTVGSADGSIRTIIESSSI